MYPTKDRQFGVWNGEHTVRHDCNCEFSCGQVNVSLISADQKALIETDALTIEEATLTNCHEQSFIMQALVDSQIPDARWIEIIPVLEAINVFTGGFTMDMRDELHPDIYMGPVKKSPAVKAVKQILAAAKKKR